MSPESAGTEIDLAHVARESLSLIAQQRGIGNRVSCHGPKVDIRPLRPRIGQGQCLCRRHLGEDRIEIERFKRQRIERRRVLGCGPNLREHLFGIGHTCDRQRTAKPLRVRLICRFPTDELFGNDAGLSAARRLQIGVHELRLGLAQPIREASFNSDLHELGERRRVRGACR